MDDIVERLKTPLLTEKIMKEWDTWRSIIAGGDRSSLPRDWFAAQFPMAELLLVGVVHSPAGVVLRFLPETFQQTMLLRLRWRQ